MQPLSKDYGVGNRSSGQGTISCRLAVIVGAYRGAGMSFSVIQYVDTAYWQICVYWNAGSSSSSSAHMRGDVCVTVSCTQLQSRSRGWGG